MSAQASFRGYENRTVRNADLQAGDLIYFPGASMHLPIQKIRHLPDGVTELSATYESWGRPRLASVRRRTSNSSKVLVPTSTAEEQ